MDYTDAMTRRKRLASALRAEVERARSAATVAEEITAIARDAREHVAATPRPGDPATRRPGDPATRESDTRPRRRCTCTARPADRDVAAVMGEVVKDAVMSLG